MLQTGDWNLLAVKFINNSNLLVCEIKRGRGMLERSVETAEVL